VPRNLAKRVVGNAVERYASRQAKLPQPRWGRLRSPGLTRRQAKCGAFVNSCCYACRLLCPCANGTRE
jgi:hypothetical protein